MFTEAGLAVRSIFHLAFNVRDLAGARRFYGDTLGCTEGRSAPTWVDYDFFGHQISLHLGEPFATSRTGIVGEHMVPMPHFGVVLELADWQALASRLKARNLHFVIEPGRRAAAFLAAEHVAIEAPRLAEVTHIERQMKDAAHDEPRCGEHKAIVSGGTGACR